VIVIRLATAADAAPIANIYRPIVESTTISFETEPPGDDEMRRRIVEAAERYPWLVCDIDGFVAGYAYAGRHRARAAYQWSVDVSVYVDASRRRRGIGQGLYTSLLAMLAAQGFFNAFAGIALPNPASVALHESLGFEPIGIYRHVGFKLGAWHDVGWWQRPLRQSGPAVRAPLELRALREAPGWDRLLQSGAATIRRLAD
jgi:phosphinothricin acetyltransferase